MGADRFPHIDRTCANKIQFKYLLTLQFVSILYLFKHYAHSTRVALNFGATDCAYISHIHTYIYIYIPLYIEKYVWYIAYPLR